MTEPSLPGTYAASGDTFAARSSSSVLAKDERASPTQAEPTSAPGGFVLGDFPLDPGGTDFIAYGRVNISGGGFVRSFPSEGPPSQSGLTVSLTFSCNLSPSGTATIALHINQVAKSTASFVDPRAIMSGSGLKPFGEVEGPLAWENGDSSLSIGGQVLVRSPERENRADYEMAYAFVRDLYATGLIQLGAHSVAVRSVKKPSADFERNCSPERMFSGSR